MSVTSLYPTPERSSILRAHEVHMQARATCASLLDMDVRSRANLVEAKVLVDRINFAVDRCIEHEATAILLNDERSDRRLFESAMVLEARVREARRFLDQSRSRDELQMTA